VNIKAKFFSTASAFYTWLQKNHNKKEELIVGFYKVGSGKPSMTWSESVDQALCFGWIDGVRRTIDAQSYCIRFTPRKPSSIWSAINIKKVKALTKKGLMQEAGIAAFQKRTASKSKIYSHEKPADRLSVVHARKLKANKKAWKYFQALAPGYKKLSVHWIMSAKQEATQLKRLQTIIEQSAKGTNPWKDHKYR
jgi:uncharacterized protein YdeI (YjbR/CyaY-like superfamily)